MKLLRWSLPLLLVACGGDERGTGQMSVQVTDAPVDGAEAVVIQFTGMEVQGTDGVRQQFVFNPVRTLDLLSLQNGNAAPLLTPVTLPAGSYAWMRLMVQAQYDNVFDSTITINGSQYEMWIPSGSETGLKLNRGFVVPQGGLAAFTLDFDLRHSIVQPIGQPGYLLKPVLRMVNTATVGSIAGSIDSALVASACSGNALGAVYVYSGAGVVPDDMDGDAGDPLASANVSLGPDGYAYKVSFLSPGSYTVAWTCAAASDNPGSDEALDFFGTATLSVSSGQTTTYNFLLPAI